MRTRNAQHHRKAFTLIELLVVIAVIGLLLAVMIPALKSAKRQAQKVICASNLKQWGLCYSLYAEDHDHFFPLFRGGTHYTTYVESLRPYYDNVNDIRTCPSARIVSKDNPTGLQPESYFGDTFSAWQIDPTAEWLPDDDWGIGSYGENSWIRHGEGSASAQQWKKITAVRNPASVPLLADARWNNAWPDDQDPIPAPTIDFQLAYGLSNWSQIVCFVMRRHKDGVNVALADMSSRHVEAEGLWRLRWHRDYEFKSDVNLDWLKTR